MLQITPLLLWKLNTEEELQMIVIPLDLSHFDHCSTEHLAPCIWEISTNEIVHVTFPIRGMSIVSVQFVLVLIVHHCLKVSFVVLSSASLVVADM